MVIRSSPAQQLIPLSGPPPRSCTKYIPPPPPHPPPTLSPWPVLQTVTMATADLSAGLIFEQEPSQILDALLPLYLSSTLLRSLQVASPSFCRARCQSAWLYTGCALQNLVPASWSSHSSMCQRFVCAAGDSLSMSPAMLLKAAAHFRQCFVLHCPSCSGVNIPSLRR